MEYDVVIIGAGMSGLAAGIRLAYFDKRVCIVEKHYAFGGLNSYYTIDGRKFDVGLHAVTNFAPPQRRNAPLNRLLRQLRLSREDFGLRAQRFSEVRFPQRCLRFSNDVDLLYEEVAREFPRQIDKFRKLVSIIERYDDSLANRPRDSARPFLRDVVGDPVLVEMLLCPVMFYGCADENDMELGQFVTIFKSIFLEGLARPREGVRRIIKVLVKRFRANGGKLMMRSGVERLKLSANRVTEVQLESGESITAGVVLSSAGYAETMKLCSNPPAGAGVEPGRISFVEVIAVTDEIPQRLGHDATIVFFSDADRFAYACPDDLVDLRSGIVCCPSNYEGHEDMEEGMFRLTWLANCQRWFGLTEAAYREAKKACYDNFLDVAERFAPGLRERVLFSDLFTPRTIRHYTGHINGAVYGAPRKTFDGRTPYENLFICGTDQGYLGIVGAMLSGITMANRHVLEVE